MIPDSSEGLNKETSEAVYFFTPAFDALNNFSAYQVSIWDKAFPTVEHAYQWKKFMVSSQPDIAAKVLAAGSPEGVKKISDSNRDLVAPDWHSQKLSVMEEILRSKTEQHKEVKDALRKSGQRVIIENSPIDTFWGVGPDEKGQNNPGKIWMKIREDLS